MKLQYESELYHFGVKGQKWGIRRYQNPDGTRTAAGRKRYAKQLSKEFNKASKQYERMDYRRTQAANSKQRAEKFASATNKGILKPLSKIGSAYANMQRKSASAYEQRANVESRLAEAALEKAKQEGFTTKAYYRPTLVDIRYYGYVTQCVYRNTVQAKFTDPATSKKAGN